MRTRLPLWLVLGAAISTPGCDSNEEPDLGLPETKSLSELKKSPKNEMSAEELKEARRKAGFKDQEELEAEARAAYEASEKAFLKGRADQYRKLFEQLRKELKQLETRAPKWASAKNPDAKFAKYHDKYKERTKEFLAQYDELTEKGSRGGNLQADLSKVIAAWRDLNGDLGPKIAEAEGFGTTLESIRKGLAAVEKSLEAIEKDDTIEAEEAPSGKSKKK